MRVALINGFTQTAASWDRVLDLADHEVVRFEPAGHGAQSDRRANLVADGDRLATEVGPAVWLGYSMGGRLALHAAVQHPTVALGLVLVSTTAGLDSEAERADRRAADETLAESIETDGVAAFVDRWLAGPLWATLPREAAGVDARLTNTAAGLAASLRLSGTGAQQPLWDSLGAITCPVLVVTGGADVKFGALGERLAGALMNAQVTVSSIPGAGHAVPWEQPASFNTLVDDWLAGLTQ